MGTPGGLSIFGADEPPGGPGAAHVWSFPRGLSTIASAKPTGWPQRRSKAGIELLGKFARVTVASLWTLCSMSCAELTRLKAYKLCDGFLPQTHPPAHQRAAKPRAEPTEPASPPSFPGIHLVRMKNVIFRLFYLPGRRFLYFYAANLSITSIGEDITLQQSLLQPTGLADGALALRPPLRLRPRALLDRRLRQVRPPPPPRQRQQRPGQDRPPPHPRHRPQRPSDLRPPPRPRHPAPDRRPPALRPRLPALRPRHPALELTLPTPSVASNTAQICGEMTSFERETVATLGLQLCGGNSSIGKSRV